VTDSAHLAPPRRNRLRVGIGAAVILLVLGLAVAVLVTALGSHGDTSVIVPGMDPSGTPGAVSRKPSGAVIYVHILGAVAKPGLFELKDGDRAVDAIAAAGGFTEDADQAQLNLARFVVDGEQIVVPVLGATPVTGGPSAGGAGSVGTTGTVGGKVNLNTATLDDLETLPRVGPAMAQKIIDWRTANGRFSAVEDLMSVSGVGDKTFAQLKDLVTV
jgi:competence protein ComEA